MDLIEDKKEVVMKDTKIIRYFSHFIYLFD
jgi:hypothetical protein